MIRTKHKNYTLRDVAQEAGVSKGTISNYLNNPERVKPMNRERIERAIQLLDFTPNVNARILATGVSKNIALYVLSERLISPTTWLHQLPVIQTICDELASAGYSMLMRIVYADDLDGTCERVSNCVEGKAADGILFLSMWEVSERITSYLLERQCPFVVIGSYVDAPQVCSVFFDNYELMNRLVDSLVELGHRKIGYVSVRSGQQDMKCRFQGYLDGMKHWGLNIAQEDILYGDFSIASGYSCMIEALNKGWNCSAVLCGNDNMAVGVLKALEESGRCVPENVSVVGIDNSIAAEAASVQLNTVQFDLKELGKQAVRKLMELISGNEMSEWKMKVGYQFIPGNTVRRIN